jgi:2-keto-3-deoxy-galactonokinase
VGDLDNGVFATRDKASQELTKAGGAAVDFLREAASDKRHSPEAKGRLQAILESLERTPLGRDELRQVRAVGLLETIASTEALAFLETLAHGWSAARQTLEARESLLRLQNR